MTISQQQFLELLRSGLWGKAADTTLFQKGVDWKAVLRIATEQTVQVIVADGIETLPEELWPPKEIMIKLMMIRIKIQQMHNLLNSTLNQIVEALNAENILSVLLKGQGCACADELHFDPEEIDHDFHFLQTVAEVELLSSLAQRQILPLVDDVFNLTEQGFGGVVGDEHFEDLGAIAAVSCLFVNGEVV